MCAGVLFAPIQRTYGNTRVCCYVDRIDVTIAEQLKLHICHSRTIAAFASVTGYYTTVDGGSATDIGGNNEHNMQGHIRTRATRRQLAIKAIITCDTARRPPTKHMPVVKVCAFIAGRKQMTRYQPRDVTSPSQTLAKSRTPGDISQRTRDMTCQCQVMTSHDDVTNQRENSQGKYRLQSKEQLRKGRIYRKPGLRPC